MGCPAIERATEATAPGFGGELSRDIRAHPVAYLFHLIGFALPLTDVGEGVEGLYTGIEALHQAFDLENAVPGTSRQ